MIRLFTGYDRREAAGWHVFCESVMENSSEPVEIIPITGTLARRMSGGTNAFTRARFLVPHLCGYKGWAIFADGADMMARADLAELWAFRNLGGKEVWCAKHDYQTSHGRKYVGTPMESDNLHYWRKNWASLFLIDCSRFEAWTPEYVERAQLLSLLQFADVRPELIGAVPMEWNWLIGEYGVNLGAKIAHYTLGIPGFEHYASADFADEWRAYAARAAEGAAR